MLRDLVDLTTKAKDKYDLINPKTVKDYILKSFADCGRLDNFFDIKSKYIKESQNPFRPNQVLVKYRSKYPAMF